MRIEPTSSLSVAYDRRNRGHKRRRADDRREQSRDRRRARHSATPWLNAPFATQLIGQCLFDDAIVPADVHKAYTAAASAR